jgi:hypothetical protein
VGVHIRTSYRWCWWLRNAPEGRQLGRARGYLLYTDSASSYRAVKGYVHAYVNHTQKE